MKDQSYYLAKAEENLPELYYKNIYPQINKTDVATGDSFILDLGEHCVGHFSFKMDVVDDFIDAPVRLIIKFGEDMREIDDDFSTYHGSLSNTWLQEESLLLDHPQVVKMPRRYSCRYVKITVDSTRRPITLSDFCFTASTCADPEKLVDSQSQDPQLKKIDEVSAITLKECMQTFFEDGPKRDRRLWIGDLRLEALTNYYTYNNLEIVKRCLYLFAAGQCNGLGFLPSYVYETPYYFSGRAHIADYALLYVVTVCDYFEHTSDTETVYDLLDICKAQLDSFERILDDNGIVTPQSGWFSFIDWCPGLSALTALQGVYLYTLDRFASLLSSIGDGDCAKYRDLLAKARLDSKNHLFDQEKGLFVNPLDKGQTNVHSQVWMILGGAIEGDEAIKALGKALGDPSAKHPVTPYMWHYVIEAMLKLGLKEQATNCIKEFWGGMLKRGADTFYEVYVPDNPDFSPYGDRMINSLCHAWSCTPAYFIRKFGL
jgi:hypothetical protein